MILYNWKTVKISWSSIYIYSYEILTVLLCSRLPAMWRNKNSLLKDHVCVLLGRDADFGGLQTGLWCVPAHRATEKQEAPESVQTEKQAYVALPRPGIPPCPAHTQEQVITHTHMSSCCYSSSQHSHVLKYRYIFSFVSFPQNNQSDTSSLGTGWAERATAGDSLWTRRLQ